MFYNPAALAGTRRAETEVSGEAFGGRWIRVPEGAVIPTPEGSATRSLQSAETLVVSTTFATAFALTPKWSVGIGLFSPLSMDAEFTVEDEDSSFTARRSAERLQFGPAVGWQPHPDVRIGLSMMGVYDQLRSQHRLYAGLGDGEALSLDRESTSDIFGVTGTLGTSVRVHRLAWVGATVSLPTFIADQQDGGSTLISETGNGGTIDFEPLLEPEVQGSSLTGWRAALGGSVGTKEWSVALDAYATAPVPHRGEPFGWGVRVGGRGSLSERFGLGGGLFTDQGMRSDAGRLALQGDRYGAMLGFEYRQPVRLAKGEAARTIEFLTILSVRYAYETGTIGGVTADASLPSGFGFNRTPATSHMALVHIGSSVAF